MPVIAARRREGIRARVRRARSSSGHARRRPRRAARRCSATGGRSSSASSGAARWSRPAAGRSSASRRSSALIGVGGLDRRLRVCRYASLASITAAARRMPFVALALGEPVAGDRLRGDRRRSRCIVLHPANIAPPARPADRDPVPLPALAARSRPVRFARHVPEPEPERLDAPGTSPRASPAARCAAARLSAVELGRAARRPCRSARRRTSCAWIVSRLIWRREQEVAVVELRVAARARRCSEIAHRVLDEARLQVRVLDDEELVGPLQQLVDRRAHRALDDPSTRCSALSCRVGADVERAAPALVVRRERDELEDPLDVELVEAGLAEPLGGLPRTSPCAHGQALIPVASTPTTRRVARRPTPRRSRSARPSPASRARSRASRARAGSARRSAPRRAARAGARRCGAAMCSASSSTSSASPITTSSIASSNSSGKRDMCTPFCAGSRSTVQSISAAISFSLPPWLMRIAFWTPLTPARESPSGTSGGDGLEVGCEKLSEARPRRQRYQAPFARRPDSSPGSSCSRATTCARRWPPYTASPRRSRAWRARRERGALPRDDRRRRRPARRADRRALPRRRGSRAGVTTRCWRSSNTIELARAAAASSSATSEWPCRGTGRRSRWTWTPAGARSSSLAQCALRHGGLEQVELAVDGEELRALADHAGLGAGGARGGPARPRSGRRRSAGPGAAAGRSRSRARRLESASHDRS